MKEIKMIMCDLDGTLLRNDKTVSERTLACLKRLKAENILFGIATGRTLYAVSRLIHDWKIAEYVDVLVGFNGAQIIDKSMDIDEFYYPISGETIQTIIQKYDDLDVNFLLYREDTIYSKRFDFVSEALSKTNHLKTALFNDEILQLSNPKLLIGCDPSLMSAVIERSVEFSLPLVHSVRSQKFLFEFMDERNSKSAGIDKVAKMHGFSLENVMAFGDEDNDLAMLKDCGVGVCMANGSENALAITTYHTASNEDDGVAIMIEKCLANKHIIN